MRIRILIFVGLFCVAVALLIGRIATAQNAADEPAAVATDKPVDAGGGLADGLDDFIPEIKRTLTTRREGLNAEAARIRTHIETLHPQREPFSSHKARSPCYCSGFSTAFRIGNRSQYHSKGLPQDSSAARHSGA